MKRLKGLGLVVVGGVLGLGFNEIRENKVISNNIKEYEKSLVSQNIGSYESDEDFYNNMYEYCHGRRNREESFENGIEREYENQSIEGFINESEKL